MALVQQYMYPLMDPIDIIESFADWNISITQQQLSRPNPDFVAYIYAACVRQVTGILQGNLDDAVTNALRESEDPNTDLYANALSINLMIYHIMRLADAAKFPDFSSKDLYAPDPARTRNILSAFINFIKFTEQCQPFISQLRQESARLADERVEVSKQLESTRRELAAARAKLAEDAPVVEALERENVEMSAHMISKKQTQVQLMKDCNELKEEKKDIMRRKEAVHKESKLTVDAVNRVRSRIVQSPERIKRTITTMGVTATEEKKTLAVQQAKETDLRTRNNALLAIEKDLMSCVDQLKMMEKDVQALEVVKKTVAQLKGMVESRKIERTELQLKSERVQKQLQNAQEKLERAQRHAEDKRIASQQTIERLQKVYEEMSLERRDNDKQVEAVRAEADEIERKMAAHLKESETEINGLLAQYWKLRHETEVYMETLANKLGIQVSAV